MKNRRFFKALLLIAALIGAFYAGMRTQAYFYEDLCLDLGGGRNPGNYPICVLER
jgi:periplasmic protein